MSKMESIGLMFPLAVPTLLIGSHGLITAIRSFLVLAKEVLATIVAFEVLIQEAMQCLKHPEAFEEYLWLQKVHTNYLKRRNRKKEVWLAWCPSKISVSVNSYPKCHMWFHRWQLELKPAAT